ncbi:hypothetical protein, partial [uncultured Sneathiella sp.]|uniref:hypothetical protein n=1 Tax=uncultured Sneathiella sp. TaxID=879315 RepID=UPI0030DC3BBA
NRLAVLTGSPIAVMEVALQMTMPEEIIQRQLGHLYKVDPAYAEGVASAVGITLTDQVEAG